MELTLIDSDKYPDKVSPCPNCGEVMKKECANCNTWICSTCGTTLPFEALGEEVEADERRRG